MTNERPEPISDIADSSAGPVELPARSYEKDDIPVRLALLTCRSSFFDYGLYLQKLLVGLTDLSVPVALVCPPDIDIDSVVLTGPEIIRHPVIRLPFLGRFNLKILAEQLRRFRPSVLHCLSETDANLAGRLSKQLNLPYLLTVNSLQKRLPLKAVLRTSLSLSRKRLAAIVVPSNCIAENFSALYPFFAERIRRINIGTFVSDSTVCFSQTGRLASFITSFPSMGKRDFSKLFDAIKHLAVEGYDFVLAVACDWRSDWYLRKKIATLGLSANVVIVPKLEPLRGLLTAADVFIQPCPSCSFDIAVLEAMSVGAAVLGCKGSVDDLIIEGKTGFIFDADDRISIYNCLKAVLDSPDKTRKIARQAQDFLRANFSVSTMVEQTLLCYRQALLWYDRI